MDYLVTVSRISGREFEEIGFSKSKMFHIPNGVLIPPKMKDVPDFIKRVVTTSRLSEEKGVDVLLRAWADVVKHEKGLQLVIIGYGPLESELKYLSQSLGITPPVEFTGRVENVEAYLKNAELFVLPSRSEGLSNALLEAMSYGIPCIATDVGGNGEVLGREGDKVLCKGEYLIVKNGILVQSEDSEGLSKAILHLVHKKKEREDMVNRGRLHIQEHYSIDLIADKYIQLYQCMVGGKF